MIQGDVEEFRRLLKNETEKNLSLHYQNNCIDFYKGIKVLRRAGAFRDRDVRVSLLHVAAAIENIEFVKLLIEAGCDVNTGNQFGQTPLHIAILSARDSNSTDVIRDCISLAKFLLDHGADVNYGDRFNLTPLHSVAKMENPKIARMLIAKGACVNECTEMGKTPLHMATLSGSISVVKLLLDNGADSYDTDFEGYTPFIIATRRLDNSSYDILKLLLERKGKCDKTKFNVSKALPFAIKHCELRKIKLLLDYGAHIKEDSLEGYTELHIAVGNSVDVIEYFLDNGVNVDARSEDNRTPLHIAAKCEYEEGCKLLLSRGANVNCIDDRGCTPLCLAIPSIYTDSINKKVGNILIEHIAKLIFLNNWVNEIDLKVLDQEYHKLKCYYKNCIEELKKMKIRKVYEDVSLFDILMKNNMASRYARNEDLIEALESAENQLNHDFPIYYLLLKEDFYKEIRKQRAAIFLNEIFNFHDPLHLANLKILSYLKDEDIMRISKTETDAWAEWFGARQAICKVKQHWLRLVLGLVILGAFLGLLQGTLRV